MAAIFSFESTVYVIILIICTATFTRQFRPSLFHRESPEAYKRILYKCSVIGDRCSPAVSLVCFLIGLRTLFGA